MTTSSTPSSTPRGPVQRPTERYGEPRRLPRPVVVGLLGSLATGFMAWVVWAGLGAADQEVRWRDVGFSLLGEDRLEVTFDAVLEPGATATCIVRALDATRGEVGLAEVEVGPAPEGSRTVRTTVVVPTRVLAVSGGVRTCEASR